MKSGFPRTQGETAQPLLTFEVQMCFLYFVAVGFAFIIGPPFPWLYLGFCVLLWGALSKPHGCLPFVRKKVGAFTPGCLKSRVICLASTIEHLLCARERQDLSFQS